MTNSLAPWGFFCNVENNLDNVAYNDWAIDSSGNLRTLSGADYILQTIQNNILLWIREYEFDNTRGMPWNIILGNPHVPSSFVRTNLENQIKNVNASLTPDQLAIYGVNQILQINFDFSNRSRIENVQITLTLNGSNTPIKLNIG